MGRCFGSAVFLLCMTTAAIEAGMQCRCPGLSEPNEGRSASAVSDRASSGSMQATTQDEPVSVRKRRMGLPWPPTMEQADKCGITLQTAMLTRSKCGCTVLRARQVAHQ
jgi:hypothetical protein